MRDILGFICVTWIPVVDLMGLQKQQPRKISKKKKRFQGIIITEKGNDFSPVTVTSKKMSDFYDKLQNAQWIGVL